jgi:hypothetical protein
VLAGGRGEDSAACARPLADRLSRVGVEREEDLYAPVKAFLVGQGYEVKAEVRAVASSLAGVMSQRLSWSSRRPSRCRWSCKGSTGWPSAITSTLRWGDGRSGAGLDLASVRRGILKLCRRLGLGLLAVHQPTARKPALVEPLLDPLPYRPRPGRRRQGLLLQEFAQRVGDLNTGGVTRRPIVTAYRQAALGCCRPPEPARADQGLRSGRGDRGVTGRHHPATRRLRLVRADLTRGIRALPRGCHGPADPRRCVRGARSSTSARAGLTAAFSQAARPTEPKAPSCAATPGRRRQSRAPRAAAGHRRPGSARADAAAGSRTRTPAPRSIARARARSGRWGRVERKDLPSP